MRSNGVGWQCDSMVLFAVLGGITVVCALAPSLTALLGMRLLQGIAVDVVPVGLAPLIILLVAPRPAAPAVDPVVAQA